MLEQRSRLGSSRLVSNTRDFCGLLQALAFFGLQRFSLYLVYFPKDVIQHLAKFSGRRAKTRIRYYPIILFFHLLAL